MTMLVGAAKSGGVTGITDLETALGVAVQVHRVFYGTWDGSSNMLDNAAVADDIDNGRFTILSFNTDAADMASGVFDAGLLIQGGLMVGWNGMLSWRHEPEDLAAADFIAGFDNFAVQVTSSNPTLPLAVILQRATVNGDNGPLADWVPAAAGCLLVDGYEWDYAGDPQTVEDIFAIVPAAAAGLGKTWGVGEVGADQERPDRDVWITDGFDWLRANGSRFACYFDTDDLGHVPPKFWSIDDDGPALAALAAEISFTPDVTTVVPLPVPVGVHLPGPTGVYAPSAATPHPDLVSVGVVLPGPLVAIPAVPVVTPPTPVLDPPGILTVTHVGASLTRTVLAPYEATWQRERSGAGGGSVTVDQAGAPTELGSIEFAVNGRVDHHTLIETTERKLVDVGEEARQVVAYSGRGLIAELDRVLVYPDLGAEHPSQMAKPVQTERVFNWTASTGVDSSTWPHAVETLPNYDGNPPTFLRPEGWPARATHFMWDRSSVGSVPTGDVYFRATTNRTPAGRYQLWIAADDEYELWFDGTKIASREGYYTGQAEMVELDLGYIFHLVALRATNRGGRAGVAVALCRVQPSGVLAPPFVASDSTWRCNPYPKAAPGMTVGKVMTILFNEAMARAALSGGGYITPWTLAVDPEGRNDSGGRHWPTQPDITLRVGMTYLEVLDQFASTYLDYEFVGRSLRLYRKDTTPTAGTPFPELTDVSIKVEI